MVARVGPIMINHKVLSKSLLLQGVAMYCSLSVLQCVAIYIYAGEVAGLIKGCVQQQTWRHGIPLAAALLYTNAAYVLAGLPM